MLKTISNLRTPLNKTEQQSINGGRCFPFESCDINEEWDFGSCQCVFSNS
ncbi:hypothetical protein [Tenacibaculum sp. nBUS_03]